MFHVNEVIPPGKVVLFGQIYPKPVHYLIGQPIPPSSPLSTSLSVLTLLGRLPDHKEKKHKCLGSAKTGDWICPNLSKTGGEGAKMFENGILPTGRADLYGCWALLKGGAASVTSLYNTLFAIFSPLSNPRFCSCMMLLN